MPRDGSNIFTVSNPDFVALTTIESTKVDANFADIVQDLNNMTSGVQIWTGPIKAAVGTAALPGYTFNGDPNTGMYWIGADNIGWSVNGAIELDLNATRLAPGADDGLALGSSSRQWSDVFLAPGRVIRWNNTDVTITHSTDSLFFAGATNGYAFDQAVVIASGKALSFDNGDVTLTHSANNLTLAGGEFTLPNTGLHLLDTNASHDLIIAPGSNLTADRTLTITTGDAAHTLDISGAGTTVTISEGTGTPGLTFGGAAVSMTFGARSIQWTQVDNRVDYYLSLTLTAKGSSTGTAVLTLGAAPTPANGHGIVISSSVFTGLTAAPVLGLVSSGGIALRQQGTTATANLTDAVFQNTTSLVIAGSYFV